MSQVSKAYLPKVSSEGPMHTMYSLVEHAQRIDRYIYLMEKEGFHEQEAKLLLRNQVNTSAMNHEAAITYIIGCLAMQFCPVSFAV